MKKDVIILGKFYLKNGNIIEEKIVLDKESNREYVNNFINNAKEEVKLAFKENIDFQFTLGSTIFRGSEIAAVTITEKE